MTTGNTPPHTRSREVRFVSWLVILLIVLLVLVLVGGVGFSRR